MQKLHAHLDFCPPAMWKFGIGSLKISSWWRNLFSSQMSLDHSRGKSTGSFGFFSSLLFTFLKILIWQLFLPRSTKNKSSCNISRYILNVQGLANSFHVQIPRQRKSAHVVLFFFILPIHILFHTQLFHFPKSAIFQDIRIFRVSIYPFLYTTKIMGKWTA